MPVACAINSKHHTELRHIHIVVDGKLWRIPVWVCLDEACMTKRGATCVLNRQEKSAKC